jgi:hypothetical protein
VTRYVTGCIGHIGIAPLPDTGRRHVGEYRVLWPRYRYIVFIGIPMYRAGPALRMMDIRFGLVAPSSVIGCNVTQPDLIWSLTLLKRQIHFLDSCHTRSGSLLHKYFQIWLKAKQQMSKTPGFT